MIDNLEKFKRTNFFPGLVATPGFWNEMIDYGTKKERFYNRLFHGYGVIHGVMGNLEISAASKGGGMMILVAPGAAVDKDGRVLFLYESCARVLDFKKFTLPCTVYVVMKYKEEVDDFFRNKENPDFEGFRKKVETCDIQITDREPDGREGIELARILLEKDKNDNIERISKAKEYTNPGSNEIDYRYVRWTYSLKTSISPYLKDHILKLLNETRQVAVLAQDRVPLPGLRELHSIALTARMILQLGTLAFDQIIDLFSPFYESHMKIIQEMQELDRSEGKKRFTEEDDFSLYKTAIFSLGDLLGHFEFNFDAMKNLFYLTESLNLSVKNLVTASRMSYHDIAFISEELPDILLVGDDQYSLMEIIDMEDPHVEEKHKFSYKKSSDCSISKYNFSYPDGVIVRDSVLSYFRGSVSFRVTNLLKGKELLFIRRSDIFNGDYKINIRINGKNEKKIVVDAGDSVNRWRNLYVKFESEEIDDTALTFTMHHEREGRDSFGKLWFYQKM